MTTLPPPSTRNFPEDSLEKKVYNIVERLSEYLPILNDRNRLGFSLYKYLKGEGDSPEILVKSTKIKVAGITAEELADKIKYELSKIEKS
jgi:hypothetical protein